MVTTTARPAFPTFRITLTTIAAALRCVWGEGAARARGEPSSRGQHDGDSPYV